MGTPYPTGTDVLEKTSWKLTKIDASKLLHKFLSADWAKWEYKSDRRENVSEHGYADFSGTIGI